ncbi:hypothetical protein BD779DRAFT_1463289, partial [Infundibulicybe gibba]
HQSVPTDGFNSLSSIACQMDADILVSGHTLSFQAIEYNSRPSIKPGTTIGAHAG